MKPQKNKKRQISVSDITYLISDSAASISIKCTLGNDPEIDLGDYLLFLGPTTLIPQKLLYAVVEFWQIIDDGLVLLIPKEEISEDELRYLLQLYENLSEAACTELLQHS